MDNLIKNTAEMNDLAQVYKAGTLNIIGGRPAAGKTTLAFRLATEARKQTADFGFPIPPCVDDERCVDMQ